MEFDEWHLKNKPYARTYELPGADFYSYLIGVWKRNLSWKEFGEQFQHLRSTNNVVMIEPYNPIESEPGGRHLRWSFGRSFHKSDLVVGYLMKFLTASTQEMYLEWEFEGSLCHGKFLPRGGGVAILNFLTPRSTVIVVYRVVDAKTMSVCITEVDEDHVPTIQVGTMLRMDPAEYVDRS